MTQIQMTSAGWKILNKKQFPKSTWLIAELR